MSKLLGPLFYWDLIRLARKGQASWLRSLYALALLIGLFYVYDQFFPGHSLMIWESPSVFDVNELARLAEGFARMILVLQYLAVLVLTPPYVASAIPAEREGGTLPLLFTTHLTDREIVLGKAVSRVFHLFGLLLTGLPILALTQWFGGVDMGWLVFHFALLALALGSAASLCMAVGSMSQSVVGAVAGSYVLVLGLGLCCAGLLMAEPGVGRPHSLWAFLGIALLVHASITFFLLEIAIWELRDLDLAMPQLVEPSWAKAARAKAQSAEAAQPTAPAELRQTRAEIFSLDWDVLIFQRFLTLDNWPLLCKEMYHEPRTIFLIVFFVFTPSLVLIIAPNLELGNYYQAQPLKLLLEVGFLLFAYLFFGCVALRAADSLVKERARHTLTGLLMLPGGPKDVLKAKWLGSILRYWPVSVPVVSILLWEVIFADLHLVNLLVLLLLLAVQTAFIASLGLWISAWARSRFLGLTLMALVLFCLFAVFPLLESSLPDQKASPILAFKLGNYAGLWRSLIFYEKNKDPQTVMLAVVFSLLIHALAAAWLWWLARRQLSRAERS